MQLRNTKMKVGVVPALLLAASAGGLLAFGNSHDEQHATVLGRYDRAAVDKLGGDLPERDSEVVVVMETRNVCQQTHSYVLGKASAKDAAASISGSRQAALDAGHRAGRPVDITEFSNFALRQIDDSERQGSVQAAADFLRTECGGVDYSVPVLAAD